MSRSEQASFISTIGVDFASVNRMIASVNVEKSEAYKPTDRLQIFDAVERTVGFNYINTIIFKELRH